MFRSHLARVVVLAFAAVLPLTGVAQADHCKNDAAILNQAFGTDIPLTIAPQPHPYPGCAAQETIPQEVVDTRILWPGAGFVQPTYIKDLGAGIPRLEADVKGLGLTSTIQLERKT